MASAENEVKRADSLPIKMLRWTGRVLLPVFLVSFAAYCVRSCELARAGAEINPEGVRAKTFFQDRGGDGYVYLGESQARINAHGIDETGNYTIADGTVRISASDEYAFRILSESRILSLDWDVSFTEKGA